MTTVQPKMNHPSLSEKEEWIASQIVDACYKVHSSLGPGLLESVYETCFCHELGKRKLDYSRQIAIPVYYDGITFEEGFRLDVLVDNLAICELKAVDSVNPIYQAQLFTYMKLTGKRLGFLINFNVSLIKNGIRRFVL